MANSLLFRFARLTRRVISLPQVSPLDLRISFPAEERSRIDTLRTIARAVTARGMLLSIGSAPEGSFAEEKIRFGAENGIVRELLAGALKKPGGPKFRGG